MTLKIENEEKTFQFRVLELVRQEQLRNVSDFIQGRNTIRPRESIRSMEILLKQNVHNKFLAIKNKFYHRQQKLIDLGNSFIVFTLIYIRICIGDGRGLASGFHQALCLTMSGPTLNVNLAFTCFYLPLNFVEFACLYLRKDIRKNITDAEIEGLRRLLRNLPSMFEDFISMKTHFFLII